MVLRSRYLLTTETFQTVSSLPPRTLEVCIFPVSIPLPLRHAFNNSDLINRTQSRRRKDSFRVPTNHLLFPRVHPSFQKPWSALLPADCLALTLTVYSHYGVLLTVFAFCQPRNTQGILRLQGDSFSCLRQGAILVDSAFDIATCCNLPITTTTLLAEGNLAWLFLLHCDSDTARLAP